jgi:hypothetical protein
VKSRVPSPRRSSIFYEILAYFADHPEAKDTLEGIVEWWLLEECIKRANGQVKAVLTQLVEDGLLMARECTVGRVYYWINRQKMREIRRLLKKEHREPSTLYEPKSLLL